MPGAGGPSPKEDPMIDKIEHFVVLMLENRSFDHVFGLRHGVDGILDAHGKPAFKNLDPQGSAISAAGKAPFAIPTKHGRGPFHNVRDVNTQLFGNQASHGGHTKAEMSGFVASYREALQSDTHGAFTHADLAVVMQSFDPGSLPAIEALADHFVLCDSWFCEVPGPTHPNRLYTHAGTSQGFAHNVFDRPFDLVTIYELLQRHGKTWATYDFDLNEVRHFTRIAHQTANFRRFSPQFAQDIETGRLPNYSFIVPRFTSTPHAPSNDQHAPHDVRWGEQLIADVYDALRSHADVWNRCALIVTYDEHGGFFDHVAPPAAVNPDGIDSPRPDDNFGHSAPPDFRFDRLGVRVPALIVSPWVARGEVDHTPRQHTSVLKTVRERFGITQPLSLREQAASSLAALFSSQAAPRTDTPAKLTRPHMPQLPPPSHHANPGNEFPDDIQLDLLQGTLRATRASHPEDEVAPPSMPTTQAALSALVKRRWETHASWLKG